MADKKISQLTLATTLGLTEVFPVVQSSTTKRITWNTMQLAITKTATIGTGTWQASTIMPQYGGTGLATYAVGDLLYASGAATLARLAAVATGNVLISGGVTTAPSWGKVGLTTHVSGTLPIANGGTNSTTALNNNRIIISSSGALVEHSAQTNTYLSYYDSNGLPTGNINVRYDGTGLLVGNPTASGQALDVKKGASTWSFGESTQYSGYGCFYINVTPSNSNWLFRSDGTNEFALNAPSRMDLMIGNSVQAYIYNDKNLIKNNTFIGSVATNPTAVLDLYQSSATVYSLRIRSGDPTTSYLDGGIYYDGTNLVFRRSSLNVNLTQIGTSTYVPYCDANGLLTYSSAFTFDSGTLTVTKSTGTQLIVSRTDNTVGNGAVIDFYKNNSSNVSTKYASIVGVGASDTQGKIYMAVTGAASTYGFALDKENCTIGGDASGYLNGALVVRSVYNDTTNHFLLRNSDVSSFPLWIQANGNTYFGENGSDGGFGSVGIGVTANTIDASAKFEVRSTTKGILPPRMTTTQINSISSPAEGLLVYNLTLHQYCFYNGTEWRKITDSTM